MRKNTFTTFDVAKMLEVYPSTVSKWINKGEIKAFNTPGGHKRIMDKDLLTFFSDHKMPIPEALEPDKDVRIMVVDDDESILSTVKRLLGKKGFKVLAASDGFQAGEAIGGFRPNLIILDIMLPGIDGFTVCRMIKEKHGSIKVLAITGSFTEENRKKMMASGADDILAKPFGNEDLIKKVCALLDIKNGVK